MARPNLPVPLFDDASPWGTHRPPATIAARLALAHALPAALAPMTKLLRKAVKYGPARPLDLSVWGLKLRLLPRGNISEEKLYTAPQLFDRDEFAAMRLLLKPGSTFVDVGANAGIYSFWAHCCMGGTGAILAVEPDPEMGRRIRFNIASNALSDIRLCTVALSDREGTATFYVNPEQRGTNTLERGQAEAAGGARQAVDVPVTTLVSLLARENVTSVDVMKLDIEGHEHVVLGHFLREAPDSLLPRLVISEFKEGTRTSIVALLEARGYRAKMTTRLNMLFERG